MPEKKIDYDFIEIGTSNFHALIIDCSDDTVGLSIEPLQVYLDDLPNKPNVTKVASAISDKDGEIEMYHIPKPTIYQYNLPIWVQGTNSVSKPHGFTRKTLGEEFYDSIVSVDKVPTLSWSTLVSKYNINTIDYLKIDTEGHDHVILKSYFEECSKNPKLFANKILFEYNESSDKIALDSIISNLTNYEVEYLEEDVLLKKIRTKHEKAYVLYATEKYYDIVRMACKSLRTFSKLPIFVYLLDSDLKIDIENTTTINWKFNFLDIEDTSKSSSSNFYIDRTSQKIYELLIQRPLIVKDALEKYSDVVAYIDSDSIATQYCDRIFDMYDSKLDYPYFVEGIYEYLHINGRGGAESRDDLSTTLEHPACELFGVNQYVRQQYRQTGYFVAGQNTIDFLDEWYWMCNHPKVLKNFQHYAPYHEETIANVILWKYNRLDGLPYIYVNGGSEIVDKMNTEVEYKGPNVRNHIGPWLRAPQDKETLLFYHGEKRIDKMEEMIEKIKGYQTNQITVNKNKKLKVLFLAPHLSTGGMPGFLLKRLEVLNQYHSDVELFVVEYSNFSPVYVVQKNKIKDLLPESNFFELGDNKMKLIDIIKNNNIDVVHVDEMIEGFDSFNQVPAELMNALYDNNRTWRVVETCHNVWFDPGSHKKIHPDAYAFCTPYHKEVTFKDVPSYGEVLEFPIDKMFRTSEEQLIFQNELGLDPNKTHIVNVGLWTSGKNQKEGIEIARQFEGEGVEFHFIGNQAPNFQNYWEPLMSNLPSNVHVWGERNDVSRFMKAADVFMFNSTWECNPLVVREAASYGLKILSRNLPQYVGMFDNFITPLVDSLEQNVLTLRELLKSNKSYDFEIGASEKFAKDHYNFYKLVASKEPRKKSKMVTNINITQYFVNQPFLEITGESDKEYEIKFFDEYNVCHYHHKMKSNHFVKLHREYFTKWNTKIWEDGTLIYDVNLDYKGKRVFINFDSKSLGDNVAWVPYALEFKKVHECDVVVCTHWNHLFRDVYPELEFVDPGSTVHNIHGQYTIGWFYNVHKEPEMPNTVPLQQAATNILGLEYKEIQPRISYQIGERPYEEKYITIATNSTSGCKFWTREGWQELINHLHSLGYKVINVSKENNPFDNCEKIKDTAMDYTMNVIHHSEFFIGLSSGLSWLSWAMGKQVVMISNFTEPDHEFTSNCIRITNPKVCNGCWNSPIYKFDKGDWDWCPIHKGTKRQFECHTSITAKMVVDQIEHLLVPKLFEFKKPKIQIKHLLTKIEDEREILSIESIKSLEKYGFNYQPIINEVYDGLAPVDGCNRPEHISKDNTPGEFSPGYGLGWLTGRHYGCYLAHRGVLETISDEYEYTLVFEADALITSTIDEFIDIIFKSCEIMEKDDVYYLSFSNNPSRYKEKINEYFSKTGSNQDCAHAYIIRNKDKEWWLQRLIDCKWDAADVWFNYVFRTNPKLRYTTNKSHSIQGSGYSLIDKVKK